MIINKLTANLGSQCQIQQLKVIVVQCFNLELENTESAATEVVVEYGDSEKWTKPSIGVSELGIAIRTCHPFETHRIIGSSTIHLRHQGSVDSVWTLLRTDGSRAGDIQLKLQLPNQTFQQPNIRYTAPTLATPFAHPLQQNASVTRPALLYQLLPYDSLPPQPSVHRPITPGYNVPYPLTPPPVYFPNQPMSYYPSRTTPPAGYYTPPNYPYYHYFPTPGSGPSSASHPHPPY